MGIEPSLSITFTLRAYPLRQLWIFWPSIGYHTVAVFCLVGHEFSKAPFPCREVRIPLESKRFKFRNALGREDAFSVMTTLIGDPCTEPHLSCWNITVAVSFFVDYEFSVPALRQ